MLRQATQDELKEKLQVLKGLYTSRHYTQCAKFGERLLDEINDDIHPVYLAYLNFYTALSHDTLAREATLKNRFKELNAAEKFYSVAITVLTPTSPTFSAPSSNDEQPPTPTSPDGQHEQAWRRRSSRPGSLDLFTSYRSSTSSTASYAFDLEQDPDLALKNFRFPAPPERDLRGNLTFVVNDGTRHVKMDSLLSPLSTPAPPPPLRPRTPDEFQLPTGTSAFVGMLEGHLASVRDLRDKTGVQSVRFAFPTPEPSPIKLKLRSLRSSQMLSDEDRESLRQKRRKITWRPRFDPTSVQKLCSEALAELS